MMICFCCGHQLATICLAYLTTSGSSSPENLLLEQRKGDREDEGSAKLALGQINVPMSPLQSIVDK